MINSWKILRDQHNPSEISSAFDLLPEVVPDCFISNFQKLMLFLKQMRGVQNCQELYPCFLAFTDRICHEKMRVLQELIIHIYIYINSWDLPLGTPWPYAGAAWIRRETWCRASKMKHGGRSSAAAIQR